MRLSPSINKKIVALLFVLGVCLALPSTALAAMPAFAENEAVYLVDEATGSVLVDQNGKEKFYPASTTKMMTTLVALDYVADKMDSRVTVGDEVNMVDSTSSLAEIKQGESLTWKELFYGLLLPSGNDAALTIAVNVARMATNDNNLSNDQALKRFVEMMNEKGDEMGLENYHFVTPHGLHDDNHYMTAEDMLLISREALKNKDIREIVKSPTYSHQSTTPGARPWRNTNFLVVDNGSAALFADVYQNGQNPLYNKAATGVKTGFTDEAGRCLVFSAEVDGKKLLGVIFKAADNDALYNQANAVIESLKNDYEQVTWTDENNMMPAVTIKGNHFFDGNRLKLTTVSAAASTVPKDKKSHYVTNVALNDTLLQKEDDEHYKILGDIEEGQEIGALEIKADGKVYQSYPLYAGNKMRPRNIVDFLFWALIVILIIAFIVLARLYFVSKKNKIGKGAAHSRKGKKRL